MAFFSENPSVISPGILSRMYSLQLTGFSSGISAGIPSGIFPDISSGTISHLFFFSKSESGTLYEFFPETSSGIFSRLPYLFFLEFSHNFIQGSSRDSFRDYVPAILLGICFEFPSEIFH